jgi:hypothetical protein
LVAVLVVLEENVVIVDVIEIVNAIVDVRIDAIVVLLKVVVAAEVAAVVVVDFQMNE